MSKEASKFIEADFNPDELIAVVLIKQHANGRVHTVQNIEPAGKVSSLNYQLNLHAKNGAGYNILVGMNPLRPGATGRTKDDIGSIRHLYLDMDVKGTEFLNRILNNDKSVPRPNWVLNTSPDHYQLIWRVKGYTPKLAEWDLKKLAMTFGGDPAATDISRVMRMPGFVNQKPKYTEQGKEHEIGMRSFSRDTHPSSSFSFDPEPSLGQIDRFFLGLKRGKSLEAAKREFMDDSMNHYTMFYKNGFKDGSKLEVAEYRDQAKRFHPSLSH